jgi:hypothetical protein
VIVRVEVTAAVPLGVTVAGLKLHAASFGKPLQAKVTCWLKPPEGVIDTVVVAELPAVVVPLDELSCMVKLPVGAAATTTLTAEEVEAALAASPP